MVTLTLTEPEPDTLTLTLSLTQTLTVNQTRYTPATTRGERGGVGDNSSTSIATCHFKTISRANAFAGYAILPST